MKTQVKPTQAKQLKSRSEMNLESKVSLKDILVWPNERDIMARPERLRYVRKIIRPQGCVFCSALETGISLESLMLFRSKLTMVIMNKYPYNNGHLLVLPQRHVGELSALTPEEYLDLMVVQKMTVEILQKTYGCEGLNMGLNMGSAAGAGIPEHLHFHLIPRWRGDTNFFPLIAQAKVIVEDHQQTFEKLQPLFDQKAYQQTRSFVLSANHGENQ